MKGEVFQDCWRHQIITPWLRGLICHWFILHFKTVLDIFIVYRNSYLETECVVKKYSVSKTMATSQYNTIPPSHATKSVAVFDFKVLKDNSHVPVLHPNMS